MFFLLVYFVEYLMALEVPRFELNRETLGADITKVMPLYGDVKIEPVPGLDEQFYEINVKLHAKSEVIYKLLHQIYYFLRCR
jgi:hypothetical protein